MTTASPPTIEGIAVVDPLTGNPSIVLTVTNTQTYNVLTPSDASFEDGIGTAVPLLNCMIGQTAEQALDKVYSLKVAALATGEMKVRQGPFPVVGGNTYSITAAYRARFAAETCAVSIEWYDGATLLSTVAGTTVADDDTGWTAAEPFVTADAPSNANLAYLIHDFATAAGPIAVPGIPTVTPTGTTGSTPWFYKMTSLNSYGESPAGPIGGTATGNATLTGSNYNALAWTAVAGATGYNIYRAGEADCEDIAIDFATCADLITAFATCAALLDYPATPTLIGTSATNAFNDTGFAQEITRPPTVNTTGEAHYVDEVGIFLGIVSVWTDVFSGTVKVIRDGTDFVVGASPLFPTSIGALASAEVVDRFAPYGLPATYVAILTINLIDSPPSIPSAPILMPQAPDTVQIYGRMGWATDEDISGELEAWLSGIGQMVQAIDSLAKDDLDLSGAVTPGWSQALDLDRAPTSVLAWLGQFVGVRFDPSLRDDQKRFAIDAMPGFARGTVGAIIAAANQYLSSGHSASIVERDISPYHLAITVPSAGVAGPSQCRELPLRYAHCFDLPAAYPTCADIWDSVDRITMSLLAAIPAGLVSLITYD